MLKQIVFTIAVSALVSLGARFAGADEYVNGYDRANGTHVDAYWRSDPDGIKDNNWSTYPNVNPHNGRVGTHH